MHTAGDARALRLEVIRAHCPAAATQPAVVTVWRARDEAGAEDGRQWGGEGEARARARAVGRGRGHGARERAYSALGIGP
jgi:hypothetical protein